MGDAAGFEELPVDPLGRLEYRFEHGPQGRRVRGERVQPVLERPVEESPAGVVWQLGELGDDIVCGLVGLPEPALHPTGEVEVEGPRQVLEAQSNKSNVQEGREDVSHVYRTRSKQSELVQ